MAAERLATDKLLETPFMKSLQRFGEALANNKVLSSLSNSMMGMIAIIMVGAIFQILATIPTLFGWATNESPYYQLMMGPYNMTMGLLSLALAFFLGYNYARSLGLKPLINGLSAMILFLMVAAPIRTVTLQDGTTLSAIDSSTLGGVGIFTAIVVAILSVRIAHFCEQRNIAIRMPDVVPPFLAETFNGLLPFLFNVILWYGLSTVVVTYTDTTLPVLINNVLSKPIAALNSVPGMLVAVFLACLMWFFGIHGTIVVLSALMPIALQAITENAAAVAAGQEPKFYPVMLFLTLACAGGTGNTLSLVLMALRSKSEQLRAVSRAALIPGICNINEPVTFGFPIMYNPILAIPYILNPILVAAVVWVGYAIGFFKPAYIPVMAVLPLGVMEFLSTLAWQNLLIPVVGLVVSGLCYYPFFKVYEKQLVEREAAARAEAAASAD
ncbi:MAG: PTS transporter subunit EIIC [Bacillota bacterium]|nr:MAG: PTS sugar transporter subunit IIC [Bacillota bacterium]